MEILFLIIIMMIVMIIKGMYDKQKAKKFLLHRLETGWGKIPKTEYNEIKYHSLQYYYHHYYKQNHTSDFLLDEITWNDLELNELYFMINNTGSAMGEEILWALLHDNKLSKEPLTEREEIIRFFQENKEERLKLQTAFAMIGKDKNISVYEYMDRMDSIKKESNGVHYIGIAAFFISIGMFFFSVIYGGICLVATIIFNLLTYYKRKGEIEIYYSVISYLIRMLTFSEKLSAEKISGLKPYLKALVVSTKELKGFRKGAPGVTAQNPTGDMLSIFLDYFRILFHSDLIRFNLMMNQYYQKKDSLIKVFETIGFLDAMCAVASFRTYLKSYCLPEFTQEKQYISEELYHPYLTDPVTATITANKSVLVTGSNASGKSTFLKAAAISTIMAQTIHTVCAKQYKAPFYKTFTSMALSDNLFENESYFIVEIKSLKRILDAIEDKVPVLCFVDEILRGTNTVERIAASSRILYDISNSNAIMFAATHDIELTYMLDNRFDNYHFEEQINNNQISFKYQLLKGRATSQNAIALLGMLGYPDEIINDARETAAHFIQSGEWKSIIHEIQ